MDQLRIMEYESILKSFECPFTWNMNQINLTHEHNYNYCSDKERFFPLIMLMNRIMSVYVSTERGNEIETVLELLKKCETDMTSIIKQKTHEEISRSILQATQAHVLKKFEKYDELELAITRIKCIDVNTATGRSMLQVCKSIAWSKYDVDMAIKFIREALEGNPECCLSNFILGKELRRKRRDSKTVSEPTDEEKKCFKKSYELSKDLFCGVYLAQMYREDRNLEESDVMYDQIYDSAFKNEQKSNIVLLKLALGFIRRNIFEKAKKCLDLVQDDCATRYLYLHYQGLYYKQQDNFEDALPFLEKAITDKKLGVEKDYIECLSMVDHSFNKTECLLKMLRKYKDFPSQQVQCIILELALNCWINEENIKDALKHFHDAIELVPKSRSLTNHYSWAVDPGKRKNIIRILEQDILPKVYNQHSDFDETTIQKADYLRRHCDNYFTH